MLHGNRVERQVAVETHELEAPRHIGHTADDLRIEQITEAHRRTADRHRDHDAVERPDVRQFVPARKEPQPDQKPHGRTVARHTAISDFGDDRQRMRKIVLRLVKKAVTQPRTDDRSQRAVNENRLRNRRRKPLALAEIIEELGADENRQRPHQPIVTDIQPADGEKHRVEIPYDVQRIEYHFIEIGLLDFVRVRLLEREGEGAAHAHFAAQRDMLAVRFDDMFDDRQPQPRAAVFA